MSTQTVVMTVIAYDKEGYGMGSETLNVEGCNPASRKDTAISYAMTKWPDALSWIASTEETHKRVNGKKISEFDKEG